MEIKAFIGYDRNNCLVPLSNKIEIFLFDTAIPIKDRWLRYHVKLCPSYFRDYTFVKDETDLSKFGKNVINFNSEDKNIVVSDEENHYSICQHNSCLITYDTETELYSLQFSIELDSDGSKVKEYVDVVEQAPESIIVTVDSDEQGNPNIGQVIEKVLDSIPKEESEELSVESVINDLAENTNAIQEIEKIILEEK